MHRRLLWPELGICAISPRATGRLWLGLKEPGVCCGFRRIVSGGLEAQQLFVQPRSWRALHSPGCRRVRFAAERRIGQPWAFFLSVMISVDQARFSIGAQSWTRPIAPTGIDATAGS